MIGALALAAALSAATPSDERADVAAWIADLSSNDAVRQEAARRHLFAHPASAIGALADGLASSDARTLAARLPLLTALAPESARPFVPRAARHAQPAVRAAAAAALAADDDEWPDPTTRELLADSDAHVAAALLEGLDARTLPVRRRFATTFGDALAALVARGDPSARRHVVALLVLDDSPSAGERMLRLLPALAADERVRLLTEVAARAPPWDAELLRGLARLADQLAPTLDDAEPARRLLALRMLVRFDREFRAGVDDETLRTLLRFAGRPAGPAQEHAAAALATLLATEPAVPPRLAPRLRELEEEEGEETSSFEPALEPFLRVRGVAGIGELIELLVRLAPRADSTPQVTPSGPPARALALLGILARLPCEAMARLLEEQVAPRLAPSLRPAFAEVALRMPACEARDRLLLDALRDLAGDARLRPFEALGRSGNSALLGFLLDALDGERDGRVRARMIEQIAESYGASDPDDVLALLRAQFASPRPSDRVAALEGVPFVALGRRAKECSEEIVRRFAASDCEALLHVLAQIGGDVAERTFADLARRLAPDPTLGESYRFLLSRAGRLRGEPTRALLLAALDDARPRLRETALRALVERGDPAAIARTAALVAGFESGARAPLLADLGGLRHLDGYSALVRQLLVQSQDEASRIALLELADAPLREGMVPATIALLENTHDPDEKIAAIEALGRLGGDAARAVLDARIDAALVLDDHRFHEADAIVAEGRAALLARASADPAGPAGASPSGIARPIARMLLRLEAARAGGRVLRTALGLPAQAPLADPALIAALAARPPADAVAALAAEWQALGPAADLCDERFFSECAQSAWLAEAPHQLCEWFDARVLALWPPDSAADFRALLPPGPRRELLRSAALAEVDEGLLADVPRIVAALARGTPTPRETAEALGRSDPLLGSGPGRTLAVLAELAEGGARGGRLDAGTLAAAFRAASGCPPLQLGLAALAARDGLELAADLGLLVAAPAPADAELVALRVALEAERR